MRSKRVFVVSILAVVLAVSVKFALSAQDRYALRVPDGLAFSEFKGYDAWQDVSVSETAGSVKAILGNPIMISASRDGVPDNGKPYPEGSKIVKIEWIKKKNPASQYFVEVPDTLKSVSFMVKDSRRFEDSHGWGYAKFEYDPGTKTFRAAVTGTGCGDTCHKVMAARDYVFTAYPPR